MNIFPILVAYQEISFWTRSSELHTADRLILKNFIFSYLTIISFQTIIIMTLYSISSVYADVYIIYKGCKYGCTRTN